MSTSQVRLFEVIGLLRRSSAPLSLTEISRNLRIAPSSTHAILCTLLAQKIVVADRDKRYRLGPALFYLSASYARNTPIYRATWNELIELAHGLELSAAIAVPWDQHHLILAVNQYGGAQTGVAIGSRVPILAGSYGKAYYAWSGAPLPTQLRSFTPAAITDAVAFGREVARVRELGYATDNEEFVAGVGAVATGVTSDSGYQGLAALMGTIDRMRAVGMERAGKALAALGARASVILGDREAESWSDLAWSSAAPQGQRAPATSRRRARRPR